MDTIKMASKNKRRNIILSVIAVIEIVALIIFGVYSWIESAEDVGAQGENLKLASSPGLIIRLSDGSETNTVNINNFLGDSTGDFILAEASSVDANTIFLRHSSSFSGGEIVRTYRQAVSNDDSNVRYIDISFQVLATSGTTPVYFAPYDNSSGTDQGTYLKLVDDNGRNTYATDAIRVGVSFDNGATFKIFSTFDTRPLASYENAYISSYDSITTNGGAIHAIDNDGNVLASGGFADQIIYPFEYSMYDSSKSTTYNLNHALTVIRDGEAKDVVVRVWLEGQDENCVDEISASNLSFQIYFTTAYENTYSFTDADYEAYFAAQG